MPSKILDIDRLKGIAAQRRTDFRRATPYPHIVLDDFLPTEIVERVADEFNETSSGWAHYYHYNQRKLAITDSEQMGPHARRLLEALQSDEFVRFIEELTGLEGLLPDHELDGAGMHMTLPGGHLNIHTDFLSHPSHPSWRRQVNLLLYLNRHWEPEWDGNLEMWSDGMRQCERSYPPNFNRCIIFQTGKKSLHGHPRPLSCPPGDARRSLALYYFQESAQALELSPTRYLPRPEDPRTVRWLIAADTALLNLYSWMRRHLGVRDGTIARILKYF